MPITHRLSKSVESNDVGVFTSVGEQRLAISSDEDRQAVLSWRVNRRVDDRVVLARVVDHFPIEQSTDDLDRLTQPFLANRSRVERDARRRELGGRVARPYTPVSYTHLTLPTKA